MSDSENDASDSGPYRMRKPSDRAKEADVIIALRSSVEWTFLPTSQIQTLPKPMGIYFAAFKQVEGAERGLAFPGPVGKNLIDHLVPFIRHRTTVTLDAANLRHSYMQERLRDLMQQDDFDLEAVPQCLRAELLGEEADLDGEDESALGGMAEGSGSGGEKRQRRHIAKADLQLDHFTRRCAELASDQCCFISFYENAMLEDVIYLMTFHDNRSIWKNIV